MTKFYVVGTPIGNLEDISFRAVKTLAAVDFVLCEDTRVTKKILSHYNIATPTISYHAHSANDKKEKVIALLREGKNLALVTDAGTPGISDPGSELVSFIKEKLSEEISNGEIKIESVPGVSALTTAISVSGANVSDFIFLGFLPHKKGRQTLFKEIVSATRAIIFYESPHRIIKTLEALKESLSNERKVIICRELTKIFEEVVTGSPSEVLEYFIKNEEKVRGEFVVIVEI